MSQNTTVDNDTQDVMLHVPPGRERAPFFRYIRINLPRLTKAVLLLIIAALGGCAAYVASSNHEVFPASDIVLWIVIGFAAVFVVVGVLTKLKIWDFGVVPAFGALLLWGAGLFTHAPFVWNGAEVYEAAAWNTMMLSGVAYLLLYWALNYGILVAYPDDQGFED